MEFQGLDNPVELWLAGGGKFHLKPRRKIPPAAEVLPCWRKGIEAVVMNPALQGAFWFGRYTGMRLGEVLPLRWVWQVNRENPRAYTRATASSAYSLSARSVTTCQNRMSALPASSEICGALVEIVP